MSWFNTSGVCPEIILFSRVRYDRNPSKLAFDVTSDAKKLSEIYAKIDKILLSNGFRGEKIAENSLAVSAMMEKQLIGADMAQGDRMRALYLNDPCNLIIALGGADLISVQAIMAGQALVEAKNTAAVAEELIDGEVNFAYNESIGYLSPYPERCGSGVEFSAALYLPSLRLLDSYDSMCLDLLRRGVSISPMFKLSCNGDLYVVSYTPPHLADEDACAIYFGHLLDDISARETKALRMMFPDDRADIEDRAYRALGTLCCAKKMSVGEMLRLISDIRLYLCLTHGENDELPSVTDLNFLSVEGLDCSLISSSSQKCTSADECERLRASFLKKYIFSKVKTATKS